MSEKENKQQPAAIEDLTVKETESENVKGGAAIDYMLVIDGIKGETEARHLVGYDVQANKKL